jgi:electron transport complex protein RnfB
MISALWVMVGISLLLGAVLGYSAIKFKVEGNPLVEKIDAVLPQTQCGQCGYPGCMPYAEAIAKGEADINKCPPGGEEGIRKLAELLGVEYKPFGEGAGPRAKAVAFIDEQTCIGCTLCLQACPVDAIVGAAKQMHTIIISECTGCELCVAPCPVDCISMVPIRRRSPIGNGNIRFTRWSPLNENALPIPAASIRPATRSKSAVRHCAALPSAGHPFRSMPARHRQTDRAGDRVLKGPTDRHAGWLYFSGGACLHVRNHHRHPGAKPIAHPSGLPDFCATLIPDGREE